VASSTAATATDVLWGWTPIKTFMSARTSVLVGSLPLLLACAEDIPTSGGAPIPHLSHSARHGHRRAASREQANPSLMSDRKFTSDPYRRPGRLAAADHQAPARS
jgi:hypothetical protein